jgi:hypothetical protein
MGKRAISWTHDVDRSLKLVSAKESSKSSLVDELQGEIFKLMFMVLPDRETRFDIRPESIGIDPGFPGFTNYRAVYGSVQVKYFACPDRVIVYELSIPEPFQTLLEEAA